MQNEIYAFLSSIFFDPSDLIIDSNSDTELSVMNLLPLADNSEDQLMMADLLTYLPNDILVKLDRASMSCGLETRTPYLDHRVAEIAWRMPISTKIPNNFKSTGKWALKKILRKYCIEFHLIFFTFYSHQKFRLLPTPH